MLYEYRDYFVDEEGEVKVVDEQGLSLNYKICNYFNKRKLWRNFKRFAALYVIKVESDTKVLTPLGEETAIRGQYIAREVTGEKHIIQENKLLENFIKTEETDGNWVKYRPIFTLPGVFAVRVHKDFKLYTKHGQLEGQKGDFLVKSSEDKDTEYPTSLTICRREVFIKSYRQATDQNELSNVMQFIQLLSGSGFSGSTDSSSFSLNFSEMKLDPSASSSTDSPVVVKPMPPTQTSTGPTASASTDSPVVVKPMPPTQTNQQNTQNTNTQTATNSPQRSTKEEIARREEARLNLSFARKSSDNLKKNK